MMANSLQSSSVSVVPFKRIQSFTLLLGALVNVTLPVFLIWSHLESLQEYRLYCPILRVSDSINLGQDSKMCLLTYFEVMLMLLLLSHFENYSKQYSKQYSNYCGTICIYFKILFLAFLNLPELFSFIVLYFVFEYNI